MVLMWKIDFDSQSLALFIELSFTLFTKYNIVFIEYADLTNFDPP